MICKSFENCIIDMYIDKYEDLYQYDYDIAIFDICLDNCSGIELASRYALLYKNCIIVFVSYYDDLVFDVFDIDTFTFI